MQIGRGVPAAAEGNSYANEMEIACHGLAMQTDQQMASVSGVRNGVISSATGLAIETAAVIGNEIYWVAASGSCDLATRICDAAQASDCASPGDVGLVRLSGDDQTRVSGDAPLKVTDGDKLGSGTLICAVNVIYKHQEEVKSKKKS